MPPPCHIVRLRARKILVCYSLLVSVSHRASESHLDTHYHGASQSTNRQTTGAAAQSATLPSIEVCKGACGSFSIMLECRGSLLCVCIVALLVSTAVAAPSPKLGTARSVARNIRWQYQLSDEGVITKLPVSSMLRLASDRGATSVVLKPVTTEHTATASRHGQSAFSMHNFLFAIAPLQISWYRSGAVRASDGACQEQERHMCADSSDANAQGVQLYDIDMDTAGDGQLADLKKQIPGVKVICYIRWAQWPLGTVWHRKHSSVVACAALGMLRTRHLQQRIQKLKPYSLILLQRGFLGELPSGGSIF